MSVLRDILRRRMRSVLTISGVAVGVFALVVLGALAEKSNTQIERAGGYYDDKVTLVDEKGAGVFGFSNGNRPIPQHRLDEVRGLEGVRDVAPQVSLMLDETAIPVGVPTVILGGDVGLGSDPVHAEVSEGRMFAESEHGVTVVGQDLVKQLDAEVGGTVELRGEEYEVVGILGRTFVTVLDQAVFVPLADAQAMYAASLPDAFRTHLDLDSIALQATVAVAEGENADEVARRINRDVEGVLATGPTELRRQVSQVLLLLNLIVVSVGAIALLVGGLSVVTTMTVAVAERTREVGVKRSLGASRARVARDVLVESGVMGGSGGVLGLAAGGILVTVINAATASRSGVALFEVTGRLAAGAMLFSLALGMLGGLYPAWYAARMDPVDALAYE